MTTVIAQHRLVASPPEDVWRQLTDWGRAPAWMGVDELTIEGPLVVGARLTFRARGKERTSTVEAVDPPSLLVLRSVQGSVSADYTYRLQEVEPGRTEVSLTVELVVRGALRVLGPVIRSAIRRADGDQLDRLLATVDRPTTGGA